MKFIALLGLFCVISAASSAATHFAARDADACSDTVCSGDCICASNQSPLATEQTPQFITLTFNDAVTDSIFTNYLNPMLSGRLNPDGNQVATTFYVPHEYTDYERVNELYNMGQEIAVHSVSKNSISSYWTSASVETLVQEFQGQREIISNFANIPIDEVVGARVPNFEMAGNNMFEAYQESGIQYDNSWTALSTNKFFPYTLDYLSSQPCTIGSCPTESFAGIWTLPIIDLVGANDNQCNAIQACGVSGNASTVSTWLMEQFNNIYQDNKAPMTLVVNSAWFVTSSANYDGFIQFLDNLYNYDDVFLVSHKQLIDWMKNPVAVSSYSPEALNGYQSCAARTCTLMKDEEYRYMKSCVSCPSTYPWLGNPLGTNE